MSINAYFLIDKIFFGIAKRPTAEKIKEIYDVAGKKFEDRAYDMVDRATEDLDAKTAALLTHISILITGLFVLYSIKTGVFRYVILTELCLYLLLAILCLRTIRFTFTYIHDEDMNQNYIEEYYKRVKFYNFTANATIYVTIIMILSLIINSVL